MRADFLFFFLFIEHLPYARFLPGSSGQYTHGSWPQGVYWADMGETRKDKETNYNQCYEGSQQDNELEPELATYTPQAKDGFYISKWLEKVKSRIIFHNT